ncbi:MAG: hypothetical protein LBK01_04220 [Burkholderiaceae bacterium]|nr:hypothetical protein [Burkholderiaceae bacterium]
MSPRYCGTRSLAYLQGLSQSPRAARLHPAFPVFPQELALHPAFSVSILTCLIARLCNATPARAEDRKGKAADLRNPSAIGGFMDSNNTFRPTGCFVANFSNSYTTVHSASAANDPAYVFGEYSLSGDTAIEKNTVDLISGNRNYFFEGTR